MYYLIKETLEKCDKEKIKNTEYQYVVILTSDEWREEKDHFDMGIDLEPELTEIFTTKAEVNFDSLTGTFCIPDRNDLESEDQKFAFALDEKGVVFIDDSGFVERVIQNIKHTKRWRLPGMERFLYDFLDQIVKDDLRLMENFERELDAMEQSILDETTDTVTLESVNDIRGYIRDMRIHYEQLMDLGQEFVENENNFFKQENIRYFKLFLERTARLHDTSTSIRDYTLQIRDLYKAHLDIKQNRIMTVLTVVTTIFMPLTLIAGWYGMNFRNMPELEASWGYPGVIIISLVIVIASLIFFKKKKWL